MDDTLIAEAAQAAVAWVPGLPDRRLSRPERHL
jgi:hypothetical protein